MKEKDAPTLDQLENMFGKRPQYASGGQIEGFREGWALNIMGGETAHYYRRNRFDIAAALCGKWSEVRWIYGPGNYPRCKTCERTARKRHGLPLSAR